jgi:uncharacterized protein YegP (UPF0339 family)
MAERREIIVFERDDGLYDWHVIAGNGEIVYGSLQGFTQRSDAAQAAQRENPGLPFRET